MKELTSLEVLSNIEGTTSSEAVEQLFETIRNAETENNVCALINLLSGNAVSTDALREDIAVEASTAEKRLIIDNFPSENNNFLIVPKVIDE